MNQYQFIEYLRNSDELNDESLQALQELLKDYPYFQTAHLLLLKNLFREKNIKYTQQLKLSAVYITDRSKLYNYIYTNQLQDETTGSEIQSDYQAKKIEKNESKQQTGSLKKEESTSKTETNGSVLNTEQVEESKQKPAANIDYSLDLPADSYFSAEYYFEESKEEQKEYNLSNLASDINKKDYQRSFTDWLMMLNQEDSDAIFDVENKENGFSDSENEKQKKEELNLHFDQQEKDHLIDKFLTEKPRIVPKKINLDEKHEDISKKSVEPKQDFFTETLAKIYIQQKSYSKAIHAYEKLSLKYPEKRTYFANQIKKVKDLINKQ